MDKAALVKSDLEAEGKVIQALSRANIPITLLDWNYVPQLHEWQLVVATPWYDSRGPRETNRIINDALVQAGVYQEIPIRRLFVKSPRDPMVKIMEKELKFKTEGSIHIVQAPPARFAVMFTPYTGKGGALPAARFSDQESLCEFLRDRVGIAPTFISDALILLGTKGRASIPNVQLSLKQAQKLGLA
jgi:hypothetical protein